ncbi:FAD-dependent monooxygenase [Rhizobium sp. PL01]|uniref:FAD-dependent monooxygenase n=1 Tax=Rhizobium sp. PL01 TaxID=3085631 RepID=UPI0029815952|nr:FAD-dependent monooxygenase [Rhizobium sp. PL01]MDW5318222.1 FAD-dependent monooxygenase [Rhizobium sp. PL01]
MTYDVVIAGAGPVGLFLACELRLTGLSVLVLERADRPNSPMKEPPFGLRGLSAPTTDAFYRRGLLNEIVIPQPRQSGGHFAGIPIALDRVDTANWTYRLPTPAAANMATTMQRLEAALTERAADMGVDIKRGIEVEGLEKGASHVEIRAGEATFFGRWLVGCDGGRSAVRKLAGFDFIGTDPEFTGYSVQVKMADPDRLAMGRIYTPNGMYFQSQPGAIAMVEFDSGAAHRSEALTLDHVQSVLRRVSSIDVTLTALKSAASWTDRSLQATRYRIGRVLLAGDAAHIHSPLGGQGLNLGLGDAMNLGWKLAAVVRGRAPDGLLDSYFDERHPVGAQVLDWSRAQVSLMRPSPSSRALEGIIRDLVDTRDGATYFAQRAWGVSLRYDLGGGHPIVGLSAPDFQLKDGRKLGDLLHSGRGLLLDFDGRAPLQTLATRWADRVIYATGEAADQMGLSALLVRPDGFVVWAAEAAPELEDVTRATSRWFGGAD